MKVTFPSAQYIRYPKEYHQIMAFVSEKLQTVDDEPVRLTMPESMYMSLSMRNLLNKGKIYGVTPMVLTDYQFALYMRDVNKTKGKR